jgi:hypothetical protein
VAFVVCQVSVVDMPLSMLFGFAEIEAVGDGGGGGGGGGGGAAFFLQAPNIMMAPKMNTRVTHFIFGDCFTFSSLRTRAHGGRVHGYDRLRRPTSPRMPGIMSVVSAIS